MKTIFKRGIVGVIVLIIVLIPIIIINNHSEKTELIAELTEGIPLQQAVENNKTINIEENKQNNKNTEKVAKKATPKKTTTKVTKKVIKKSSNNNSNAYKEYAHDLVINTYNWTEHDFECLINLWNRESGWNPNSHNSKSGAHGIPQALPASKMASEGSDYYTNGYTQIRWGLKYIKGRYDSPSKAWQHFQKKHWY